jgi:hypothetical protein
MALLDDFANLESEAGFNQHFICLTVTQISVDITTTDFNFAHFQSLNNFLPFFLKLF